MSVARRPSEAVEERRRGVAGEVLPAGGRLLDDALEVAARQAARTTRTSYASVYRGFVAFVGVDAGPEALTAESVRRYRDRLEALGRAPATIARHVSALRQLAIALGADPAVRDVRSPTPPDGRPRALTADQLRRVLRMPDRRTVRGRRDLAILQLLATAGLRRVEAAELALDDVDERPRARDGAALRRAVRGATTWWVTVTAKRRTRRVPLTRAALDALTDWFEVRPETAAATMFVSLPLGDSRAPLPLDPRDVGRVVETYLGAAGIPLDSDGDAGAHVLRHTFCTELANRGVPVQVIRQLAGHADIRTTMRYIRVDDAQLEDAILAGDQQPALARRAATRRR